MFCYVKDQQTDGTLERVIQQRYVSGTLILLKWPRKTRKTT